ncbi:TMEM1 family protein-like protein [Plenodomus tracheiphilus IPT5]|uniref:TMEM1 family protein-like protein n=1 Tax=Plenodomus tracheiphilus IPT5 TaxID=1408161 RepID=A0A6A7BI78_9PLEO|nr:TMEM1 family protein-like protein [Plenodomus tracheiphilus IPT5]
MSAAGNGAPALGAAEDVSRHNHAEPTVMDGLSSSKVTVEYHDPSGVFSLVQEDLAARLPLRNLHWKAPTRPLRSIDSLHVDLVPSKESAHISSLAAPGQTSRPGTSGTPTRTTEEILRPPTKEKERRHQIPGLRQTPYLKIYLLRCDDSDTYKSTARKQVREWVKEHTPPSQSSTSSTQENHDAFEWMILHVVVPETPASSQPRWSTTSNSGEKEKSGMASKWTRGTTTLLEKLRADFNIPSKSAPDRVAQIRVPKDRVPPKMLPGPAPVSSPAVVESPQEQERAWSDVISRFKVLILLSFDLRVGQYEENIRKNEAQRSFPGWNFNTFFILKEGLARGFESVGLVEDALLGYDELSIGLDTIIRDQASGEAQGGTLLSYTEDLHQRVTQLLAGSGQTEGNGANSQAQIHDDRPIDAQKKDYRGLILANNISILDFRIYVFARQMSLLLRLGNSASARSDLAAKLQPRPNAAIMQRANDDGAIGMKSSGQTNESEDLFSLADLCSRALNFVTFAGRLMRDDLINGAKTNETTFPDHIIENIVRSWTFAALDQVLRETSTISLPFTKSVKSSSTGSSGKSLSFSGRSKEQKISIAEQKSMIHPSRSSSLTNGRSSSADMPYAQPTTSAQVVFENGQYQDRPTPNQAGAIISNKNGLQELAGLRAQLLAIQRRLLEHVGRTLSWEIGWAAILPSLNGTEDLSEVNLDEDEEAEDVAVPTTTKEGHSDPILGIVAGGLVTAVSSIGQFRQLYEGLSDMIVKHYIAAGQNKSAESVLGDLAALRFEMGDFAAASAYFGRMASQSSLFAESRWNTVETTMLKMHARCLKKLNRKDKYVRTLLDLLAKSAASRMAFRTSSKRADSADVSAAPQDWLNDDKVDTTGVFQELVGYSQQLPYDVTVKMPKYFGDVSVEPYVRHYDDKDGFQLRLQFRHLLEDEIEIRAAKVRLVSTAQAPGKEMWLENTDATQLKKGLNRIWLGCNINTIGPYMVDKIILEAKRIIFVQEPLTKTEATTPLGITTSVSAHSVKAAKKARILCFPRAEAFHARIYLSHFIHIDKPRHIEIECTSGWNEIVCAEIRLKSASAGLRLRTANATVVAGDVNMEDNKTPGTVVIGNMPANASATLKIPYDMETILQDLAIKVELDYTTQKGTFQFVSLSTIPVELPLDVNVHDHFKSNSLFSKFNIKTANHVPLELLDVELEGSDEFEVHGPRRSKEPLHVFPKQPVAVTYKITKKATEPSKKRQSRNPPSGSLALSVEYRCLDEDVLDRARKVFADAAAESPVHRIVRLLTDTFTDRLQQHILPHQYERIALLEKLDLGAFENMGWTDCLESLPLVIRDDTQAWLQKWHEENKTIMLPKALGSNQAPPATAPPSPYPPRRMIITVSIPQTHILHTASLDFSSDSLTSQIPSIATVGQPIMTTLRISHTRRWAPPASLISAANLASALDPIDFVYTIEANPETWLIAGQRRVHFTASEDEKLEWPIMLIPLKPGSTLLPNVEIRTKIKPKDEAKTGVKDTASAAAGVEEQILNCETDYLSYGESVMVVPDLRSSTVGISNMSLEGARSVIWLDGRGQ